MFVCPSIHNAKCVRILKGYFLRSEVDEIWLEDRCSGKINAHFLRILLKIILTEIISILTIFWLRINSPHPPNLLFSCLEDPTFISWGFNIAQVTPPVRLRPVYSRVWQCISHISWCIMQF